MSATWVWCADIRVAVAGLSAEEGRLQPVIRQSPASKRINRARRANKVLSGFWVNPEFVYAIRV